MTRAEWEHTAPAGGDIEKESENPAAHVAALRYAQAALSVAFHLLVQEFEVSHLLFLYLPVDSTLKNTNWGHGGLMKDAIDIMGNVGFWLFL